MGSQLTPAPVEDFAPQQTRHKNAVQACCRPAARLHPAGLVHRPGRGDGDLLWRRLSCLLPGEEHMWTSLRLMQPGFRVLADDDDVRGDWTRHPCCSVPCQRWQASKNTRQAAQEPQISIESLDAEGVGSARGSCICVFNCCWMLQ